MQTCTIVALRHVEREKSNPKNPQMPTPGGEIAALAMGTVLRREYNFLPHDVTASPQGRSVYTARLLLAGIFGIDLKLATDMVVPVIKIDERLDDYSTDKRPVIKACLASAKTECEFSGLEVEQSSFLTEDGLAGIRIKSQEAMEVFNELAHKPGMHLVAGMHGCTIDAVHAQLAKILDPAKVWGPGTAGGIFDKVEGFIATYEEGTIKELKVIRQPPWLKAMGCVLK